MAIQEGHDFDRSRLAEVVPGLAQLESSAVVGENDTSVRDVRAAIERVKANTRELFSDDFTVVEREDCEIENDRHVAFCVVDSRPLDALLERYQEWHMRLLDIPESIRVRFRLSIDARP